MTIRIKAQKDYLLTEVNIEVPADLGELDTRMKEMKSAGKIVSLYNQGGVLGVNVEQRTKIPDAQVDEVRRLVGVNTKIL
jgi:hypothetical protein